jgi:hypothetical protein
MDVTLLKVTAVLYLLASVSFIVYIFRVRDFVSSLSPIILFSGFAVHTAALGFISCRPVTRESLSFVKHCHFTLGCLSPATC